MGQGAANGDGPREHDCVVHGETEQVPGHVPDAHFEQVPVVGSGPMVPTLVLRHTLFSPTIVAAAPFEHCTELMVLRAANADRGYTEPSLQWKEKLAIVDPGHVISKGPTRDDAFPLEYIDDPVLSKTSR